jgi:hypothetical protein
MIEVLLRHPDHRGVMRQEAFVLAVTHSNKVDVLETLLDFNWDDGDSIEVTESILINAVLGPSGNRWSEFSRLLKRVKNTEVMTGALMTAVLTSRDENAGDLVRGLLDYFGQNIAVTDAHIKTAISQGSPVTELKLLMVKNPTFEVIGATLIAAARYAPQLTFVCLMADNRDITDIKDELFYAAAKNCTYGHQITEHLLGLLGDNAYLPEGAVMRALRKWTNRGGALFQLLQSRHIPKITRRVVASLTKNHDFGPSLLGCILENCPLEARSLFTEEAIASTARRVRGYEMIKALSAEDVPLLITERLAAATAKNRDCGPLIIEELLAGGHAIVITEDRMETLWEDHPEKNAVMRSFRARLSDTAGLSSPPVLPRSSGWGLILVPDSF